MSENCRSVLRGSQPFLGGDTNFENEILVTHLVSKFEKNAKLHVHWKLKFTVLNSFGDTPEETHETQTRRDTLVENHCAKVCLFHSGI